MKKDEITGIRRLVARAIEADDEWARAALHVLLDSPHPLPPTAMGSLYDEARALAQQVAKTGHDAEWKTPPLHSQAMERLFFRLVTVMEAFHTLLLDAKVEGSNDDGPGTNQRRQSN